MGENSRRDSSGADRPFSKSGDRSFIDAVLFRAKTGIPWRDLPERFSPWKTVYNRFDNWASAGVWEKIFKALRVRRMSQRVLSSTVQLFVHIRMRRAEKGIERNALGRSRGGVSTKLHAVVDTEGLLLHVTMTQGQGHEMSAASELLEHARGEVFIGDTGYDSDAFIAEVRTKNLKPVIHPHPCRKRKMRLARKFYAIRYRVECFFHDLKRFRAVATRYEKSARNYLTRAALRCSLNFKERTFALLFSTEFGH